MDVDETKIESQSALEELFVRVCDLYFPRWRTRKSWAVRLGAPADRPKLGGYCDLEARTIWISTQGRPEQLVEQVMIHEITHAIVGTGHGVRFQRRMRKASDAAEATGNSVLAGELRQEVAEWAESPRYLAAHAYAEIRDLAWECDDYELVLRYISEENGLLPEEFEKRYRRARKVFDEARIEAEQDEHIREAWTQRKGGRPDP